MSITGFRSDPAYKQMRIRASSKSGSGSIWIDKKSSESETKTSRWTDKNISVSIIHVVRQSFRRWVSLLLVKLRVLCRLPIYRRLFLSFSVTSLSVVFLFVYNPHFQCYGQFVPVFFLFKSYNLYVLCCLLDSLALTRGNQLFH